jgi:hypothetical protein
MNPNDRDAQNTVLNRPLMPLARQPIIESSEENIAIMKELNKRAYPTFFNNPEVEAALPLHPLFAYVAPHSKPNWQVMSIELSFRMGTPVSQMHSILFHVDLSLPYFQQSSKVEPHKMSM